VPTIGAFDDPPPWLFPTNGSGEGGFAASPNVRLDATRACFLLWFAVVVALVETDVLGTPWSARSADIHGVEGRTHHVHVVDVGACQRDGQWHALTIYENVAFGAELCAIGRIGPRELPPFGALTLALSRDAQSHSMPTLSS
jgi:hypothetical protein